MRMHEIIELGPGGVEGASSCSRPTGSVHATAQTLPHGSVPRAQLWSCAMRAQEPDGAWLTVREARANNLRGIDVRFPVGLLTCVTGVSGSGKSTLVLDILAAHAARKLNGARSFPAKHRHIENLDFFEKLVQVDQEPIGRSPRPIRRVVPLPLLRDLYAQVPLAKSRIQAESLFVQRARRPLRTLPGRRRDRRHAVHARRVRAVPELRGDIQSRTLEILSRQVDRTCST
jgi:excinuclease ABC subunit A